MQEEGTGGSHPFTRYNFLEKVKLGEGKKQLVLPAGVLFLAKLATKAPRGNPLPQLELGMLLGGLSTPVCPGLGNCWAPGPDLAPNSPPQLHPWLAKHPTEFTSTLPPVITLGKSVLPTMFASAYQLFIKEYFLTAL